MTNAMTWDPGMHKIFGVDPENFCGTGQALTARLHPDSKRDVLEQVNAFLLHGGDDAAEFTFSILTDDQEVKRLTSHAIRITDERGAERLVGVAVDISELELARTQSLYRSDFENLLLNLSMRLIKPLEANLDDITNEVLQDVAEFVSADRAYIFEYDFETNTCSNTHEWCNIGITPEIQHLQDVPVSEIGYWVAAHESGQPFILRSVNDLEAAHPLRQILEPQGIRSLATFPLMHGEHCEGFIGFDAVSYERRWSDVDTSVLNLLSKLLVNMRDKARIEGRVRETEQQLRLSRDEAEEKAREAIVANRSKTDFIARVSHEIRTPLHAVNGLANELLNGVPESDTTEHLQTILTSGETMLELINDVLDFARIESEGIVLQQEPIDLQAMLQHLHSLFKPLAQKKSLTLELRIDDDVPPWVAGDRLRIGQILHNLLSNALKFTNSGSVTLSASLTEDTALDDEGRRLILLCVTDTGIGIPAHEHMNLFTPFFQLENAATINRGTGLGLPIANMLGQLMGGGIDIQSSPGQGSRFCARLRLKPLPSVQQATADQATQGAAVTSLAGLRILLAEDNPVNARLMRLYLRDTGSSLDHAINGAEACDLMQHNHYDVVLMDCQMPVMDGFEATRRIRETEADSGCRIPIIGVTANALTADIRRCLDAGMDTVLNKPFSKTQLIQQLATLPDNSCDNAVNRSPA